MSLPDRTTVLIVGAGPTGLALALSFLHRGFRDFVIVDAVERTDNTSRALVIHAATLEALDTIGCADQMIAQGVITTRLKIGTRSAGVIYPDMSSLKGHTRYPYVIFTPQNLTEHTLVTKLKSFDVNVQRPLKAVGMKRNAENAFLTDVSFEDGRVVTANYVIGADGARSVVRTVTGIHFADPFGDQAQKVTNLSQMVLADITFDSPDDIPFTATLSPHSFFLCAPMPQAFNDFLIDNGHPNLTGHLHRIVSGVPPEDGEIPRTPGKEYLQDVVDRFGPYFMSSDPAVNPKRRPVRIKDVVWATRYRNHASLADTMFARLGSSFPSSGEPEGGPIVLIGDAAHIHAPTGGQGMNLGLRDGIFLGEVLLKHMKVAKTQPLSEADKILREFSAERLDRAMQVIKFTKGLLKVLGMDSQEWVFWWLPISIVAVRDWVLWLMGWIPQVQRKMAWELSGLGRP